MATLSDGDKNNHQLAIKKALVSAGAFVKIYDFNENGGQ